MEGVQDLIIPVGMDVEKVLARLQRLSSEGKRMGKDIGGAAGKAKKGPPDTAEGANSGAVGLSKIAGAYDGLHVVSAVTASQAEFKRSSEYIKTIAVEFAELRKTMQNVASLKREGNNNEIILREAQEARRFGLLPGEYREFHAQFMNYAGFQIGEGRKLTDEQGEQYAGRVAAQMKGSGINPAVGAELAGALLESTKGRQNVDALMIRFCELLNVIEKGPVLPLQSLPQLSEIVGPGILAEDSTRVYNTIAPALPDHESTAVEAPSRAIDEMTVKGTGREFSVKDSTTQHESVRAFAENVNAIKKRMTGEVETKQEARSAVTKLLAEMGIAYEVHEQSRLVASFARQGVELGAFKSYEELPDQPLPDLEQARALRYKQTDWGIRSPQVIEDTVATPDRGARYHDQELVRARAGMELARQGELIAKRFVGTRRGAMGWWSDVEAAQQTVNTTAIDNLNEISRNEVDKSGRPRGQMLSQIETDGSVKSFEQDAKTQAQINEEIRNLLRTIAESTGAILTKDALPKGSSGHDKPLVAPPPLPAGRL
jgi:hypothetical protein